MIPLVCCAFALIMLPPDAAAPLTVQEAVRIALQSSPKLKAARFEADVSQAQNDREKPVARPIVTTEARGTLQGPRVTFPRAGSGDATVIPEQYGKVEINLEQVLYHAGGGAVRDRYGAQTRATAWEFQRAQNDAVQEVRRAYYNLVTAEAMAVVARNGVEMARKQLDLVKDMLTAGIASERDVKATDADLAEAEQGALKAENGIILARANLNRVMGRDPAAPIAVTPASELPAIPATPEEGIRSALSKRPELRQLEENLRAAQAGALLAGTQNQPTLSARGTAAAQTRTAFTDSKYLAGSLVVTWNPFDQGKTRSDVKEARARAGQLGALLEDAKLGIRVEVEKAWSDMREARARIDTADRQISSSEAALSVSLVRYQAGSATQMEVSGSLFGVVKARANRAHALSDLQLAAADYAHATASDVEIPTSSLQMKPSKSHDNKNPGAHP